MGCEIITIESYRLLPLGLVTQYILGAKVHHFETSTEFTEWKDGMEEKDHVYYTKQKEYKLSQGIAAI